MRTPIQATVPLLRRCLSSPIAPTALVITYQHVTGTQLLFPHSIPIAQVIPRFRNKTNRIELRTRGLFECHFNLLPIQSAQTSETPESIIDNDADCIGQIQATDVLAEDGDLV